MKRLTLCLLTFSLLSATGAYASSGEAYSLYLKGMLAERAGDTNGALSEYYKAVGLDPQALEVYKDIAQLNLRIGHTDDALKAAEKVKDLAPDQASSYLFLGNVHVAHGDVTKAIEDYEKALTLDPGNLKALENLGSYYGMVNPAKGLEYYKRYLQTQPEDAEIVFQMGFLYKKSGDTPKAIESFKHAVDLDPEELAPHLALAEIYETSQSTAAAIAEYATCVQLDPKDAALYARLGHLYYENKNWDEAAAQFQKALALEPQDASIYYWLARVAEERQQWDQASTLAEKAYQLSHDPQFLLPLAYYLSLAQHVPEAVKWLEKAHEINPQDANVLLFLGIGYLDMDKPDKAKPVLEAGIHLQPQDPQLHFQLGATLDRLKQFDAAVQEFRTVLRLDPHNATTLNYLGYSFADRGINLPEAETMIAEAVRLEPQTGAYWDSLGWVHYKLGEFAKAAEELEKAVAYTPDPLIFEHLGDAYWADKKPEKALSAWTKSLDMNKNNPALEKKIKDASQHVTQGSDQRKYLKYIEGNFRQIKDLRGLAQIKGRWQKNSFQTEAGIYYLSPDRFMLVLGDVSAPMARISVNGLKVRTEPDGIDEAWRGPNLEGLTWLPGFFSGELLVSFDSVTVRVEEEKSLLHYYGTNEDAWVDPARGVLTKYSRVDPQGGRDVLEVPSYEMVEGLWLPKVLRLENRQGAWQARLQLSDWKINQPRTAAVFEKVASAPLLTVPAPLPVKQ